jgi:hypothetical protein
MNLFKHISPMIWVCLGILNASAQPAARDYIIPWNTTRSFEYQGKTLSIPSGSELIHDPQQGFLPHFSSLGGSELLKISSFEILELSPCSEAENISLSFLPEDGFNPYPECRILTQSGEKQYFLSMVPVVRDSIDENTFLKIVRFKITFEVIDSVSSDIPSNSASRTGATGQSVLSSGEWFKIATVKRGMHVIDRAMLGSMGIAVSSIDPRNLKIFGNGGGMLPQKNSEPRSDDLLENAIYVHGEHDGSFDAGDYILFFADDAHEHQIKPDGSLHYAYNVYSDTAYYFLNLSSTKGLRIKSVEEVDGQLPQINVFDDYQFHERDIAKPSQVASGRKWYGERFETNLNQNFDFSFPAWISEENIKLCVAVMAQSFQATSFDVAVNGVTAGNISIPSIPESTYAIKGAERIMEFNLKVPKDASQQDRIRVNLNFRRAGSGMSRAWLDFITLQLERKLEFTQNELIFRSVKSTEHANVEYVMDKATSGIVIWDVTNPLQPLNHDCRQQGERILFKTGSAELKTFVAFIGNDFPRPHFVKKVANQNLRGAATPDLIIISHPDFSQEARRLSAFRQQYNGLDVLVVEPEEIYNEFSSGAQDVSAIRDFVRHLYLAGGQKKLKNLLLFGKGSYDYKDRINSNTNFVPVYGSRNSLHPIESYSSDDYYAFMDDNEGEWIENRTGDHMMDLGVGRLPVKNIAEARIAVDKIIRYSTDPEAYGVWRNQIAFVAEDGDGNIHQRDADFLAQLVDTTYHWFEINKIYVDAFRQIPVPNGSRAPEVNRAINEAVDNGTLIVNYTGHGSETRWAHQTILDIPAITNWRNGAKMPFFVTATCEFGRHDSPDRSGAEFMIFHENGGAIGILTSARPVFSNTNYQLNEAFIKNAFEKDEGEWRDLGKTFMFTKNNSLNGPVNRNFSLLGDPSLHLNLAQNKVIISDEDLEDVKAPGDTLRALSLVTIRGMVADQDNQKISSFKGQMQATVYDKQNRVRTMGFKSPVMSFLEWNNVVFRGSVTVKDGDFTLKFVVPKNINYQTGNGKISTYAISADGLNDAAGGERRFIVGQSNPFFPDDSHPPEIELFVNDTSFESGGISGPNATLLARLYDENGINFAESELGQGLSLSLNGSEMMSVTRFFSKEKDSYQSGWLRYPLRNLERGKNEARLLAWDNHNNFNEAYIEFLVVDDLNLAVKNLINYPNPFSDNTTFSFEHNRSGDNLEGLLDIVNLNGQVVRSFSLQLNDSPGLVDGMEWDGTNGTGQRIDPGIYIFRLYLQSQRDGAKIQVNRKLVIIN